MPRRAVHHEGRQIVFRWEDGGSDRHPALFVHGPGLSRTVWDRQRVLAESRPFAALDLSGHGESGNVDAEAGWETISAYAADVAVVAEEIEARFLIGHSLGVAIILHLIERRSFVPTAVAGISAGVRLPIPRDIFELAAGDLEKLIEYLHAPGRLFHDPKEDHREVTERALRTCDVAVMSRDYETCNRIDLRSGLRRLDVPLLCISGTEDPLTPPSECARLVDAVEDGEVVHIEDAAHLPMIERPDETNAILRAFFADPFDRDLPDH